ncbi:MAG: MBL fold metallo-hydrolase [Alphaproteobacteria bacterium]|nr:MBL fold metallo-hydrolase [Alphaproteobacteria bacterium]
MKWLFRLGGVALLLVAVGAGAYWYYVADGAVPEATSYKTDIAEWRRLVSGDTANLPSEIRIEFVGRDTMPFVAVQAGGANVDFARARTAFQLNGPDGSVIIDSGMDQDTAGKAQRGESAKFDAAAYGRVIAAMGSATRVAVTHEHIDHIGGVLGFPVPERLAERLVLTQKQFDGLGGATGKGVPAAYATMTHLDLSTPTRIAAGVVMIPAEGHTAGSAMFYVRLNDGREALFLGDIAWAISNVRLPALRPRFVQQFYMSPPEDRGKVGAQIRALHELATVEPGMAMIPSHDDAHFAALIASGLIKEQFVIDAP